MSPLDEIASLFAGEGAADYLGEAVTQAGHMCQAGSLAERAGAPDALVAAALLHDLGHLDGAPSGRDLMRGTDNHHGERGATWLARWFGPAVTGPVRLHVAAKRYLCAVEPGYLGRLSPASLYTLSVQGGPMGEREATGFAGLAHASDAVALRRLDDLAKDAHAPTPGLEHFRPLLERLLREA